MSRKHLPNNIALQITGEVYFTSDAHFGHKNIIKYSQRPFANIQQMNEEMITQWNETVALNDLVYVLGDFCFGSLPYAANILEQLNGFIAVLPGNHDFPWLTELYRLQENNLKISIKTKNGNPFILLPPLLDIEIVHYDPDQKYPLSICLCHYEMVTWNKSHFGAFQLFGHTHENRLYGIGRQMNVGVDYHNFKPVHIDTVIESLKDRKNTNELTNNRSV